METIVRHLPEQDSYAGELPSCGQTRRHFHGTLEHSDPAAVARDGSEEEALHTLEMIIDKTLGDLPMVQRE